MSRSPDLLRQRRDVSSLVGRHLCRRAGSRCELCETGGVPLKSMEIPPFPEEPDPERCVMLCHRCFDGILADARQAADWRFLERAAWSETPVVQVAAVRMLRRLREHGADWAGETLDALYLPPEVEEWA